jgi:ComF family protein
MRFEAAVALGAYGGTLRAVVLRMKHAAEAPLASAVGRLFWQVRRAELASLRPEVVVPVPMHWRRRMQRGANSPDEVAVPLAEGLGIPCAPRLLRRRRSTSPQGPLARGDRLANVRGAFRVRHGYQCAGARVLLVDDILTTGATANECVRALVAGGAASVALAVVARAAGPLPD